MTAFLVGYLLMGKNLSSNPKPETGTILDRFEGQDTENNAETAKSGPTIPFLITDKKVISVASSNNKNGVLYFEKGTGKILEFNFIDRNEKILSDTVLPNFISSIWSPARKEVIHSFYVQSGQDYRHYSFSTDKTTQLDPNMHSLAFSPDGNLIVYYYLAEETTEPSQSESSEELADAPTELTTKQVGKIIIAQTDGQYPKKILTTRIKDLEISWPAKNQIVLKTVDSGIYILTEEGELTKFMEPMGLFQEKWSQSGKKVLFSVLKDDKEEPTLWIKDLATREEKPLEIEGSADKCAWSIDDTNIICALAKSPSIDELHQINIVTGSKNILAEPEIPIKEVALSETEDYLVFISALDDKLYGLKISD